MHHRSLAAMLNLLLPALIVSTTLAKPISDRPNIVLILTDDQDATTYPYMPILQDRLVAQGTTFTNFIFTVPLCGPSRASILRGQYAHNHQVITNRSPNGGFKVFRELGHEQSTVATWLQEAGYRTSFYGKYINGYPGGKKTHIPDGWDEWYAVVSGHYRRFELNENGQLVQYGDDPDDYETDILAAKAVDFISSSAGKTPFFIYLAPFAPHSPFTPARRHRNAFKNEQAPRPPSFNEADVSDKPAWVRDNHLLSASEIDGIDERFRARLRTLLAVDELVEAIIDELTATGELDNTFIFYTTENGFHQGEHRVERGKNTPYEESIRVPLIVRGPGVPAGQVLQHVVANIDLAPTFAELAQAITPAFVDGLSFVRLLRDPPPEDWRKGVLVQHWAFPNAGASIPDYRAVRTRNHIYIEYITGEYELYDLNADPYQLENQYATANPSLVDSLAAMLQRLSDCAGVECTIDGPVPVELVSFNAAVTGRTVQLEWQTATESNNFGFYVERSADGRSFQEIAFVLGNGTSTVPRRYAYVDSVPGPGTYFYRLRQVDLDGAFNYSETLTVEVTVPRRFFLAQNYPNPFNDATVITFQIPERQRVTLTVIDLAARRVSVLLDQELEGGSHHVSFDAKGLSSGIYFYELRTPSFVARRRAILIR